MSLLAGIFRRRRYEDLALSIDEHIAEKVDELMAAGVTREEAERAARRAFGNRTVITERSREAWQWPTFESMWADVRFALRQLARSPGFTATAVLTLGLGIAVNATMFSMVSAFLMPKMPGHDAASMVAISSIDPDGNFQPDVTPMSPPDYLAWRGDRIFAAVAAEMDRNGNLAGDGRQAEDVRFESASPNYFSLFGSSPALGRDFALDEDQPGHDHVVILSHGLWARRFGSDPAILGKTIRLNREDYTVVGVMGPEFRLMGFEPQLWTPLTLTAQDRTETARRDHRLIVFARLAPGVSLSQARAEMQVLASQAQHDFPAEEQRWGTSVRMLPDFLEYSFGIRKGLSIMMTTVAFILLIACANVAGLLLARATARQKELAIRASLGASRMRVARQLLTEGVVIALMGGALGLGLAAVGIRLLAANLSFNEFIAAVPVRLDLHVLLFAAGATLLSAVLSSLAPAVKASRANISTDLRSEGRAATAGRSRNRLRALLVGGEMAAALFLLAGTALLIQGVYNLESGPMGFRQDHLLTAGISLDKARYGDDAKRLEFVSTLVPALKQIAGVKDAAVTSDLPASGAGTVNFHLQGEAVRRASEQKSALQVSATPGYFHVAGIPLLQGREFTPADLPGTPGVVVVNRAFVHRFLDDGEPLGRQIEVDDSDGTHRIFTIVGVTGDVRFYSELVQIQPEIYQAFAQRPTESFSLMLQTGADPASVTPALRRTMEQTDPELPLLRLMSMEQVIRMQRNGNPLFEKILASFAALALVLAAIGIYGLVAYTVSQRTQEIGIRLAMGANKKDISWMILRQGLLITGIGSAVGLVAALPLPTAFNTMFNGMISFGAPVVFPAVVLAMGTVAVLALFAPARRAMQVDPSQALRSE